MEDSDEEGDETTALTRSRRLSWARRKSGGGPPHMLSGSTDMTASTDLSKWRRHSMMMEAYSEQAMLLSSAILLKRRITGLYVQLCELKSYAQLNRTGFRKVLKKFDKILDRSMTAGYLAATVEPAYPFRAETQRLLDEQLARVEAAYTTVVAGGDAEAARRDLRSHLREHVVWERNTVWRDMIGMERRAEAASLGRSLLGRPSAAAASRPRLQGDDERAPAVVELTTPLGRLALPPWLFSAAMLNLVGSLALFVLLLLVPILERAEQQNCLAMLVLVSLLWATEAIPLFVTSLLIPFLSVLLAVVRDDDPPYDRLDARHAAAYVFSAMWTGVIMLLLGGFTLAAALSKCKIDKRIATAVLSKAGTQPKTVLLANMLVAAFASMLISNVAAPVLCFSIIEVFPRPSSSFSCLGR